MPHDVLLVIQSRREREIQQQMFNQDEETLELRETFTSLQQEVEAKTKKLKKVKRPKWGDAEKIQGFIC